MRVDRKGVTRIVFVFSGFVVKIPNFSVQHSHFLAGCKANWDERRYWKLWNRAKECDLKDKVVPTLWCSWFGLIQVQARASVLPVETFLHNEEIEYFYFTTDTKSSNFGYYKNRLVCIDYA